MHHVCSPKRMLTGLLTVALAAIFAQSALAYSVGQNDEKIVAHATVAGQSTTKAPIVIPYLSHGIGVDRSLFSGKSTESSTKAPLVIPYLSHGVGVDMSLYGGQGAAVSHTVDAEKMFNGGTTTQTPDAFQRAVNRHETFVNAMNATAAASGPDAFQRAVNRNEATQSAVRPDDRAGTLGIGNSSSSQSTAVRPDDRAGTLGIGIGTASASQSQSTAVRPDDRAGLRGIGTTQVAQSASSNSGTDWSSILQFGGVVLAVLLVIAGVVFLTRPRGRVLAH